MRERLRPGLKVRGADSDWPRAASNPLLGIHNGQSSSTASSLYGRSAGSHASGVAATIWRGPPRSVGAPAVLRAPELHVVGAGYFRLMAALNPAWAR
eukprot:9429551-Pyramimonas_sp.AAC.1